MIGMTASNPHAARSTEVSLGIRSARALALVRRTQEGGALTDRDRGELDALREALLRAAAAVGRQPDGTRERGRRNIASVGLALSAVVREVPDADAERAASMLTTLSRTLETVIQGGDTSEVDRLVAFLRDLVVSADRATARRGETLVTAES